MIKIFYFPKKNKEQDEIVEWLTKNVSDIGVFWYIVDNLILTEEKMEVQFGPKFGFSDSVLVYKITLDVPEYLEYKITEFALRFQ